LLENTPISKLNISLEKLVEKQAGSRLTPQLLVQHIERIQIQPPQSLGTPVDGEVYANAVKVLIKVAPNLQTVSLIGSYMFKPTNEVKPFKTRCFKQDWVLEPSRLDQRRDFVCSTIPENRYLCI